MFVKHNTISNWLPFIFLSFSFMVGFLFLFFKDPWPRLLLAISASYIIIAAAEAVVLEMIAIQNAATIADVMNSPDLFKQISLSMVILTTIVFTILAAIWSRLSTGEISKDYHSIIIILIAQFFATYILQQITFFLEADYTYLTSVSSLQALLFLVIAPVLIQEADERENLKNQLALISEINHIENLSYTLLEKRTVEIEKVRHDINNQLSAISRLIDSGETQEAYELLLQLKGEIESI